MKKLLLLVMVYGAFSARAWEKKVKYFDKSMNEIKVSGKDTASFYAEISKLKPGNLYDFKGYYLPSNKLMFSGNVHKGLFQKPVGHFTAYYENGNIKKTADYNRGKTVGFSQEFYENGNKKEEGSYENNKKNGHWATYYIGGNKASDEEYVNGEIHFEKVYYLNGGALKKASAYMKGYYDGEISYYHKNGKLKRQEFYSKHKMLWGKCYTETGIDTVYYEDRSEPLFPGQDSLFNTFINNDTGYIRFCNTYPGIRGTVSTRTFFDETGNITKTIITKTLNSLADAEAQRLILSMPPWRPALDEEDKPVASYRNLDIFF
jgi:antitoxin component YwqK of YwqJK toxin-antitoxin module